MPPSDDFETSRKVRLLHAVNRALSRIYHRVEVEGVVRVPRAGPAIIISNHISGLDPLLVQSVVNRPIVWMMAKEYFEIGALRWLWDAIRIIPVSRDGKDSSALRSALRTLEAGRVLGIFPEGRIETTRSLLPLETGATMIALRSRAPVIPVYQTGTTFGQSMVGAVLIPQQVRLRFGPAIELASRYGKTRDMDAPTQELFDAMQRLSPEAQVR